MDEQGQNRTQNPGESLGKTFARRSWPAAESREPTIGGLHRQPGWFWVQCLKCDHQRPMALAPLVIRFGPDMPAEAIKRRLRCEACGARGARFQYPSWILYRGWPPFPVARAADPP